MVFAASSKVGSKGRIVTGKALLNLYEWRHESKLIATHAMSRFTSHGLLVLS